MYSPEMLMLIFGLVPLPDSQWTTVVSLASAAVAAAVLALLVQVCLRESQTVAGRQWVSLKAGVHQLGRWLREVEVSLIN